MHLLCRNIHLKNIQNLLSTFVTATEYLQEFVSQCLGYVCMQCNAKGSKEILVAVAVFLVCKCSISFQIAAA